MATYRKALPQMSRDLFITDGGIETDIIFHEGFKLPDFAAFVLLDDDKGYKTLRKYFQKQAELARDYGVGLVFETATWRSNPERGLKLGFSSSALVDINRRAVELLSEIRSEYENGKTKIVISGCLGPRGNSYFPTKAIMMSAEEAQEYHAVQIGTFSETEADMVTAITTPYVEEGIGITRAAQFYDMPVVISFVVETDGTLPMGQTLQDAIQQVDEATGNGPAYYMINCAHPSHFTTALSGGEPWLDRIHGIRGNASKKSHAELDFSVKLDEGDISELGQDYLTLLRSLKNLNVLGGCCGTDIRHIEEICKVALVYRDNTGIAV